jgi:hypothetical protein
MRELMIHVERAVRPVVASEWWKLAMRRELLAHLTSIYEEEKTRVGDGPAALEAALRRFGAPANLTRELQSAVPVVERWLNASVPLLGTLDSHSHARPEPVAQRASQGILLTACAGYLAVSPFLGALPDLPVTAPWRVEVVWISAIILLAGAFTLIANAFYETARHASGPRSWLKALGLLLAAFAVHAAAVAGSSFAFDPSFGPFTTGQPFALGLTVFLFGGLLVAAPLLEWVHRPYREWLTLDLGA